MVELCNKNMSFQEKELAILRQAIDKAQAVQGKEVVQSPDVKNIIEIVENFLKRKKLVCYGGTAINNILPEEDQFYNLDVEIPDYDFFSPDAMEDAKALADIYYKEGYEEVEAKAGQHFGTYKVFVNFIPVADITSLDDKLYSIIKKQSILVAGIYYAPPNFLRMSMYSELSRPSGNVGRWEKVLKRLILLNKNYPLKGKNCEEQDFQRVFENEDVNESKVYNITKQALIDQGVVFFGGYASSLYGRYMPKTQRKQIEKMPDFDVLAEDPETAATIVKERLMNAGVRFVKIIDRAGVGEIIAPHYEVRVGSDTIAFIYKPLECQSYNTVRVGKHMVRVATIDTMLSLYLAFVYANKPYYNAERILCMAQYLFSVQAKNRLEQRNVLKRFSINCYGHQETQEELRSQKAKKYKELKNKKDSKQYDEWFLRYIPHEKSKLKEKKVKKTKKTKRRKNKGKRKTRKRAFGPLFDF